MYHEMWNQSLKYPEQLSVSIILEKKGKGFRRKFGPFKEDLSEIYFKKTVYKGIIERIGTFQVLSTLLLTDAISRA